MYAAAGLALYYLSKEDKTPRLDFSFIASILKYINSIEHALERTA